MRVQRELQQLEMLVKGYQEESEKQLMRQKNLEKEIKTLNDRLVLEQRKATDIQQKSLLEQEKVFVEDKKEELDIHTVNKMGLNNAISQKQLQDLHQQI